MLSLLRLERKQKILQMLFEFAYLSFFLSYSFGIETINTFRSSLKNHTVFRPKRRKNPTRWGGTYLYSLYKGVPPSGPWVA